MKNKFFAELSRRLCIDGIESSAIEDKRLEVFLHGQPVLYVSPGNDVFMLPVGNKNEEASDLYHQVAAVADEVYEYVEAVQNAPLLHASGLYEDFRLLADFGGAVLAGQERENGQGYQFVTWIWDYDRTEVCHGHYYEVNFQLAKKDFAVRSGLISRAQLFAHGAVPSHRSLLGGRPGAEQRPTEGHPDRENKDRIHRPGPPGQTGAGTGAGTTNESVTHNIRRGP